jgi:hypothetical protein
MDKERSATLEAGRKKVSWDRNQWNSCNGRQELGSAQCGHASSGEKYIVCIESDVQSKGTSILAKLINHSLHF